MKYRKVNFSQDGKHTAIYCDDQLAICTQNATEDRQEITNFHIDIWIEGLLWGAEQNKQKIDWLVEDCIDQKMNDRVVNGGLPTSSYRELKTKA